jgi:hypothetical protein
MFDEFIHTSGVISDAILWIFLMVDNVCMDVNSIIPHSTHITSRSLPQLILIEQQNFKINQNG